MTVAGLIKVLSKYKRGARVWVGNVWKEKPLTRKQVRPAYRYVQRGVEGVAICRYPRKHTHRRPAVIIRTE